MRIKNNTTIYGKMEQFGVMAKWCWSCDAYLSSVCWTGGQWKAANGVACCAFCNTMETAACHIGTGRKRSHLTDAEVRHLASLGFDVED